MRISGTVRSNSVKGTNRAYITLSGDLDLVLSLKKILEEHGYYME